MFIQEELNPRAAYPRPAFSVIRFHPGRPFCEESDDDDPDPGGGEGFGDPNDI